MTDSMIERVARALWADRHPDTPPWPSDLDRENYRGHARAAIEAMRGPTEAMLKAGWAKADVEWIGGPHEISSAEIALLWEALLDAALSEKP